MAENFFCQTTDKHDFYVILGVSRSSGVEDITKAYKALALKVHPDKNPEDRQRAEEAFKNISRAYKTLRDRRSRNKYDCWLAEVNTSTLSSNESVQFSEFLRKHRRPSQSPSSTGSESPRGWSSGASNGKSKRRLSRCVLPFCRSRSEDSVDCGHRQDDLDNVLNGIFSSNKENCSTSFLPGSHVIVTGLQKMKKYNGAMGKVLDCTDEADAEVYKVVCGDGKIIRVHGRNLVTPTAPGGPAPKASWTEKMYKFMGVR